MTDGPGQQPPQEPRNDADADAGGSGEREVLEGRVIPSRTQAQRDADPRRQFRRQSPPAQAPEPGPAWSAQADAAAQAAPPPRTQAGEAWSQAPQQPSLDPGPQPEAATQAVPAQDWSQPPVPPQASPQPQPQQYAPQPQAQAPAQPYPAQGQAPAQEQPYAAQPQAQAPAPPYPAQGQAPAQEQPYAAQPQAQAPAPPYPAQGQAPAQEQPYAAQPQAQAPAPPYPAQGQAPAQEQPYAAQPQAQAPGQQYAPQPQAQAPAPAPQAQAPVGGRHGGGAGRVPFAGGVAPRPAPRSRAAEPGPGGGPTSPEPATPDWGALAEQQEATGARKRRVLMLTGGIVAVAVIAGGVATAVVMSGKSDDKPVANPSSSSSPTAGRQSLPPVPSFSSVAPPPPANPLDYINTAAKDKAPITPDSLFPGKQFVWKGRTYVKTRSDVTTSCAKNARKDVAASLSANGCQKLIRATYTQGGLAVTVGVAVFTDNTHAKKVGGVSQYLAPLNGGGVADFCHAVRCQMTANSVGRYAYFAISGFKNGKTLAANDTVGKQAANDASDFAFSRIVQRGKDAAAADPSRQ